MRVARSRRSRATRTLRRPRLPRTAFLSALASILLPVSLSATWSVIAVDSRTGQVIIASATCVPQERLYGFPSEGLMDVQAIVVPGVGVAAAQAGVDRTRRNQSLIYRELKRGTAPEQIIEMLSADSAFQSRQFGIVDMQGRCAGHSGSRNGQASLWQADSIPELGIYFSVQGNILTSDDVVHEAVTAFKAEGGTMADRVMAAMEAADAAGGDSRCSCSTDPVLEAPCTHKTAHVAYIRGAEPTGVDGASREFFINVTDQDIRPGENANPVTTLRMRYERWKAEGGGRE
ncbi:MAG: DUF1028 domain-containing protein [Gemmatimonadota bacterium]